MIFHGVGTLNNSDFRPVILYVQNVSKLLLMVFLVGTPTGFVSVDLWYTVGNRVGKNTTNILIRSESFFDCNGPSTGSKMTRKKFNRVKSLSEKLADYLRFPIAKYSNSTFTHNTIKVKMYSLKMGILK